MNPTGALEFMIEGCNNMHSLPSFGAVISFTPGFSQVCEGYYDRRTVLTVFFVAPLKTVSLYKELILFRITLLAMMFFLLGDVSSNSVYR